jgi:methylthioribulose-1-phosphate dehydratase
LPRINLIGYYYMESIEVLKKEMAETIRLYNAKGWSPATSTNYSFKSNPADETFHVSRSGIDKANFQENDFIIVDSEGKPTKEFMRFKPSAETLIHCALYQLFPETQVILHSHSVYPLLLSAESSEVSFQGYEIQKGFAGQTTHEAKITIPVFDNTQDMIDFSKTLFDHQQKLIQPVFIIRKHGVYAWGKDLFEAKRHLETLEYLCQCAWMLGKEN